MEDNKDIKDMSSSDLNLNLGIDLNTDFDLNNLINQMPIDNSMVDIISDLDVAVSVEPKQVTKKFNFKFYVDYLGININTIYSEDLSVLKAIVYLNQDIPSIFYLHEDLKLFLDYMETIMSDPTIDRDVTDKAYNKLKDFKEFLELFLTDENKLFLEGVRLNGRAYIDILTQTRDKSRKNYKSKMTETLQKLEVTSTQIRELLEIIQKIYEIEIQTNVILDPSNSPIKYKILNLYPITSYKYTPEEINTLNKLKFLPIYGKEAYLKEKDVKLQRVDNYYNLFTNHSDFLIELLSVLTAIETLNPSQGRITKKDRGNLFNQFYS